MTSDLPTTERLCNSYNYPFGVLVIQGHHVLRGVVKHFQIQKEDILPPFSLALHRSVLVYFMLATTDQPLIVTGYIDRFSGCKFFSDAILCTTKKSMLDR